MRFTVAIMFGIAMLWAGSASASLVDMDWHSAGDNLITLDTNTNLEWLDISATQYISYNDMVPQLAAGQPFDGWRYATSAEFDNLLASYAPSGGGTAAYAAGLLDIMNHVGISYTIGSPGDSFYRRATNGFFDVPFSLGHQIGGTNVDMSGSTYTYVAAASLWGSSVDYYASDTGHWLVRGGIIPEPASLSLLLIGGVFALRRRTLVKLETRSWGRHGAC